MKKSTDKLKDFPIPKLRNNSRMSTFTTSSSHCTGGSNQGNQSSERNKRHEGCKEIKFPLFADNINEMILFIENANKHTHTHIHNLALMVSLARLQNIKALYMNELYFYILTRNEKLKNEIEKVILFTITSKKE